MKSFYEFINEKELLDPEEATRQRCIDHIDRVKYFYMKLIEGGLVPVKDMNRDEVAKHDSDKLKPENIRRQSLRMTTNGTLSAKDKKDVYEVIREHVKSNPHHCEYWGREDEDHMSKNVDCSKMPDKYIYEMMADWASTAEERGTKIIDWYELCVNKERRWLFTEHQKDIMLECIEYLQTLIEPEKKRNYGFKYIDPAVKKR